MNTMLAPSAPVKSNTRRSSKVFGQGLWAFVPTETYTDRTVGDEAWLLADEIARMEEADSREQTMRDAFSRDLDRRAEEAAYLDELHFYGCNRS